MRGIMLEGLIVVVIERLEVGPGPVGVKVLKGPWPAVAGEGVLTHDDAGIARLQPEIRRLLHGGHLAAGMIAEVPGIGLVPRLDGRHLALPAAGHLAVKTVCLPQIDGKTAAVAEPRRYRAVHLQDAQAGRDLFGDRRVGGALLGKIAAPRLQLQPRAVIAHPVDAGQAQKLATAGFCGSGTRRTSATSHAMGEVDGVGAFSGESHRLPSAASQAGSHRVELHRIQRAGGRDGLHRAMPFRHSLAVVVNHAPNVGAAGGRQINGDLFAGQKHIARMAGQGFRYPAIRCRGHTCHNDCGPYSQDGKAL